MLKPRPFKESLSNDTFLEMIYVEGGAFLMGGGEEDVSSWEKPVHSVQLDSFYIGKFLVSQKLWTEVMKNNPSFFTRGSRPVEKVSWEDAQEFTLKLNKVSGRAYRLPTEAEWEYAARGGQLSKGYKYAGSNKLREVGWYRENSHFETKAVGLKYPNELGIYDMSGNVWEWCLDWYSREYYYECHRRGMVKNPRGPFEGSYRVVRGGAWFYQSQHCRCVSRTSGSPQDSGGTVGFRLVLPLQADC